MFEALTSKFAISSYLEVPRRTRMILALLAGISVSILAAGFILSRTRRRYRAISATSLDVRSVRNRSGRGGITRSSTFQDGTEDRRERRQRRHVERQVHEETATHVEPNSMSHDPLDLKGAPVNEEGGGMADPALEDIDFDRGSVSSDDSFHSTLESLDDEDLFRGNALYLSALDLAKKGGITCRNIRTSMLKCRDDVDFLAKVHCVRMAFDEIISSTHNRDYFKVTARQIVSAFLSSTNQDPSKFCDNFDELVDYVESETGWNVTVEELTKRKVVSMNVYDIALDFVLLDAFDDIDHPPSAIVSVLGNTWVTAGMKQSMISAAIWSLLKAKTRMLTHRDGFMSRFYLLSESLSPTLAWGFLGTDRQLKDKCAHFKAVTMNFICSVFSLDSVNYSSVRTLADDILSLAKITADQMHTPDIDNDVDSL